MRIFKIIVGAFIFLFLFASFNLVKGNINSQFDDQYCSSEISLDKDSDSILYDNNCCSNESSCSNESGLILSDDKSSNSTENEKIYIDFKIESYDDNVISEIVNHSKRITEAFEFYNEFIGSNDTLGVKLELETNPYTNVDTYFIVEDFMSILELKEYVLSLYSEKIAKEFFFKHFEDPSFYGDTPFIIEMNGNLYRDSLRYGGRGGRNIYDTDSISIKYINLETNIAEIEINYYFVMEPETTRTEYISLVKENNRWVFDEFI